ncbi:MAG: tRNA (adenosine(37)-N6)-threonylcarbamoyltransferase complex transferase subunit TsaD [Candidatus Marinimicrobia bacterium]|nr:tRNA (adenosine(37)-N6)-threonylcarbamoyltransferase complex transferase subunit TsaD [Candidatus Neomarinimicrobiota bacterium]|tara:strand:- start:11990 stop:12982 length:993 start_codon:yes stop_codon:yes gene_type:complete
MIVLGIETSCDETSCSIIKNNKVLSNVVKTQKIHQSFGGVVPDLASKDHEKKITIIVNEAIHKANVDLSSIDGIAVTYGAGLLGSLIVGLNFAKGLALGLNIPLIGISHLEGHLSSGFINKTPNFPSLSLIVSGGHTQIWKLENINNFKVISNTVDDAAGEAFDKGARILGLGYPGGPEIEKIAKTGNPFKYKFTIPEVKKNKFNFSFSGLKTSLLYLKKNLDEKGGYLIEDLAASYQHAIIESLLSKLDRAISAHQIFNIMIVGGVSANKYFRNYASKIQEKYNLNLIFPDFEYCTDNAAMIAMAGYFKLKNKDFSDLSIEPNPNIIYK